MAREFVETYAILPIDVPIVSSTVETALFIRLVEGGILGSINRLRYTVQGKFSIVNDATTLTFRFKYGTSVASVTLTSVGAPFVDKGFVLMVYLSADESTAIQVVTVVLLTGLSKPQQLGQPTITLLFAENSQGDLNSSVTAQFDVSDAGNALTHYHTTIERLSYIEEPAVTMSEQPLTKIVTLSALNNLPAVLCQGHTLYAELKHDLVHSGIGEPVFTRASPSTSIWRDGAAHVVAANEPRFSYDGATPRGMLFDQGVGEALTFHVSNLLHDSNTLCWVENGVFKYTPINTNPFNAAGQLTTTGPIYLRSLLKFGALGRQLTAQEIMIVSRILL